MGVFQSVLAGLEGVFEGFRICYVLSRLDPIPVCGVCVVSMGGVFWQVWGLLGRKGVASIDGTSRTGLRRI